MDNRMQHEPRDKASGADTVAAASRLRSLAQPSWGGSLEPKAPLYHRETGLGHNLGTMRIHADSEAIPLQRQEEKDGLHFDPLPPKLGYGFPALGGSADLSVGLGGGELGYNRGPFHAGAEGSWGGELGLNAGYGAPLLPWMMDVNRDLGKGQAGMNSLLNGGGLVPNLGNLGGFGVLGDVAGAGAPALPWGVGLQADISSEEQRVMGGLRMNF